KKYPMLSEPFDYTSDLKFSLLNPSSFWDQVSNKYNVKWDKKYESVLNFNNCTKKHEWFNGGLINACYNSIDKNIFERDKKDQVAFVHEIPIKKIKYEITYQQIYEKVTLVSRVLKNLGIKKGDFVMVYMHNSFETIASMLACARIGAIHNVIYSGTLVDTLLVNIEDCKPKLILTSTFCFLMDETPYYYLPILKSALDRSKYKPLNVIIFNRKDITDIVPIDIEIDNSLDWDELVNNSNPLLEYEPVEADHPLYLIYTSGTTNKPKGILRETGGHTVALNYITRVYYGLDDGDTFFTGSNIGWICSHTYLVYGCLMVGCKSVFLEGPYNNLSNDMWGIIQRNKVNAFLITPSTARKLRKIDPKGNSTKNFNLTSLSHISIGSERVDKSIHCYLSKLFNQKVIIEYWQTESGYQMIFNHHQIKMKDNSLGKAVPGYQLRVVSMDPNNTSAVKELEPYEIGELVIKLPVPPCCVRSLLNDEDSKLYNHRYIKYDGYFATGDLVYYDNEGYYYFVSRVDDSIHVGCDIINCSIVEGEISNNSNINDCAVIGIKDEVLTEIPLVLLVLKNDEINNGQIEQIKNQILTYILNIIQIGVRFEPIILIVNSLPKNRNGKSLKSLIRSIFNGEKHSIPSNIDNINI
ncbi:hypothetical protein DICPUDRAFT_5486, partial [Dictyostelium purpureum]